MNNKLSLILSTDSYKFSHFKQYPPKTTEMFSYLESRVGSKYDKTVFFGLQYYLKEYLSQRITEEDVMEAAEFTKAHGVPFNLDGWLYIARELGGKLPIRIRAVREGTVVPIDNVLMTVESTDPKVFWIVSYLETLLMRLWYPITVATQSWHIRKLLKEHMDASADYEPFELDFKLHDFGSRGVSSQESAMIGGAAHLVNFQGSDTVAGIYAARKYYNEEMASYSIPASEHSTMTMWGRDREAEAYNNMLEQYKDQPIFACVSDSYDIMNAASNIWGGTLKDKVIEYNGTLVVRPDSGDPADVCEELMVRLDEAFGTDLNSKGRRVLRHGVRIIQGDGVNQESINKILGRLSARNYSASNITFGMGGALLQKVDRDTQRFAFKCSHAVVDGKDVDVYKQPKTDSVKNSKRGRLELVLEGGEYKTVRREELGNRESLLVDYYKDGEITFETSLAEVRHRARSNERE